MIKYADCRQFVHFVAFFFFQTLFTLFISIKKHTFGNDTVASPALVKKKKKKQRMVSKSRQSRLVQQLDRPLNREKLVVPAMSLGHGVFLCISVLVTWQPFI